MLLEALLLGEGAEKEALAALAVQLGVLGTLNVAVRLALKLVLKLADAVALPLPVGDQELVDELEAVAVPLPVPLGVIDGLVPRDSDAVAVAVLLADSDAVPVPLLLDVVVAVGVGVAHIITRM